jgi:hypothetical protein
MGRAAGNITIDGDLGDEGWCGAVRVARWYETNPRRQRRAAGEERRLPDFYGDDREPSDLDHLKKLDRQFFVKLSYTIQR